MVAAIMILIGCIKDPAKLGIHPNTLYKGRVIEKSQNQPIKGVTVSVTDGSHVHTSQVTGDDGRFEFRVDFDAINENYSLQLDCQGYTSLKEDLKGFGQESYDYKDIVYYDNSNPSNWPTVTTKEVSEITSTTARTGGTVTYSGAAEIMARGVCWGTTHNPSIDGNHTTDGSGLGSFSTNLANLEVDNTYYVRAYAKNIHGIYYGNEMFFVTTNGKPSVTTAAATSIKPLSAVVGGNVISDNGFTVTSRGMCWSTLQNPTIGDNFVESGNGIGEYMISINDLQPSTTYYIRAYATNQNGTGYGENKSFTTTSGAITVTTNNVSAIGTTSATCGGNATVTNDNNLPIIAKGVCWSTNHNPTTSDSHTNDGVGTGIYSSSLTNLLPNTYYYVRAYAINQLGIYYGAEKSFKTTDGKPAISLNSSSFEYVSSTSISCTPNVTSDGGYVVTSRGVCWNTVPNPTTSNNHTNDGEGIGYYTSIISNLNPNNTYYVRAYATNSMGTSYSEQITITPGFFEYLALPRMMYNGSLYVIHPVLSSSMNWPTANATCNSLSFAGFTGWRLPSKEELLFMIMNVGDWGTQYGCFWSSTEPSSPYAGLYYYVCLDGYVNYSLMTMCGVRPIKKIN